MSEHSYQNNTLYFIIGALIIAVLIVGWVMYGDDPMTTAETESARLDDTEPTPAAQDRTPSRQPDIILPHRSRIYEITLPSGKKCVAMEHPDGPAIWCEEAKQ